jgi:hypothetical protein
MRQPLSYKKVYIYWYINLAEGAEVWSIGGALAGLMHPKLFGSRNISRTKHPSSTTLSPSFLIRDKERQIYKFCFQVCRDCIAGQRNGLNPNETDLMALANQHFLLQLMNAKEALCLRHKVELTRRTQKEVELDLRNPTLAYPFQ